MNTFLKPLLPVAFFMLVQHTLLSQEVEKKRLMRNINVPTKSHIFPSLTGDGLYMIFYSDYSNTGNFELKYSKKTGPEFWEEARYVENLVKHHNDHFGSYNVAHDGRYLYFSSHRASGIGKYDLWFAERSGDGWSAPQNPGKPLNSPDNDGNPSLSPDGRSLYFMRCQEMDAKSKKNCKIFVARKTSETRWGEPEPLPDHINSYHSTTPRILIDNETLFYSSERPGGKGGLDLYMTRFINGAWSEPKALDFINTARNDEFVSVPARGDLIYYTDVYKDQDNIYKAILPEAFRPKKVLLITGKVVLSGGGASSHAGVSIQAYDTQTGAFVASVKPGENDGAFFLSLPEGKVYDFSVFPSAADHTYYSEIFDLTEMQHPRWEKLEIPLNSIRPGTVLTPAAIEFESYTNISANSSLEFRRLTALMQKNPHLKMEVGVYLNEVIEDSIPRLGLNKVITDTLLVTVDKVAMFENGETFDTHLEDSISSLGYLFLKDSDAALYYYKLNYTYTNDDTQEKADAIVRKLIQLGVPQERLLAVGYGASTKTLEKDAEYEIEIKLY